MRALDGSRIPRSLCFPAGPVPWRPVDPFSHEHPILLLLPPEEPPEVVVPRILGDGGIRQVACPAPWALDKAGIDLPLAAPELKEITLETLGSALGTLLRLCDEEHLAALVARTWREAEERVRQHYLGLGIAQSFAQIFKVGPPSQQRQPPAAFRQDRIHENGFEIQYRLAREDESRDTGAPPEEGSLVLYPFDPANEEARSEAGLESGSGAVLEVFAYEWGRERHFAYWEGVAAREGWRALDTRTS